VDTDTLDVVLSDPVLYADNSAYSVTQYIVGLNSLTWVLLYYDTTLGSYTDSGPLIAQVAYVTNPNTVHAEVTLGLTSTLTSSAVAYYFFASRIDNYTITVAYVDAARDYAVSCQTVNIVPLDSNYTDFDTIIMTNNYTVKFEAYRAITTGETYTTFDYGVQMRLAIEKITDDNEFLILYTDVSNNGVAAAVVMKVPSTYPLLFYQSLLI
jgi:hypothetical protein